jgi:hypothetical protein
MIEGTFNGLYRYDDRGERFYARVANGEVIWYPSVTRIIKATSPTPHGLLAWYAKHGIEDAATLRDEAAERGTQMHTLIEEYLQTGVVILDGLPEFHQKALCSFVRFCQDHNVRPIHTERVIYSDLYVYAGACDLICTMEWKGAVIRALIDYKSGTNIYDDYAVQLGMYWHAAEAQGIGIDRVFNWSPKDFRKDVPTYTLTDQTEKAARSRYEGELEHRCRLFHATNDTTPRKRMVITGMLPNDVNIRTTDPNQVILDRHAATAPQPYESTQTSEAGPSSEPA